MADSRFEQLRQELLRAGVAPRNARRAALEIESHFQQLIDAECSAGAGEHDARLEAHRRLGTNLELLRHYAARPELCTWSRRWPSICFTIVPLIAYLAIALATLLGLWSIGDHMAPSLRRIHVAPGLTDGVDLAARAVLLWCLPLGVSAAFTLLAGRRGVALRWPFLAIVSISALASLSNVVVRVTGGAEVGNVGAGIAIPTEYSSSQSMHAGLLIALSLVPLWILHRAQYRAQQHRGAQRHRALN
jgi:hypothetical protein